MDNLFIAYLSLFVVSCFFLSKAGSWTAHSLTHISQFLRWKEFIVASILMAFTTTLPELFVGIISAVKGAPELSLSNIIGSNIINLTLAIGWVTLLTKNFYIENKKIVRKDSFYLLFIASMPFLLMADMFLSRFDGIILLICLIFYVYKLIIQERRFEKIIPNSISFKHFVKNLALFFGSVILLVLSAEGVTHSAISLATLSNISLPVIGLFLVALSTNLPELVFCTKVALMHRPQLSLGNLMGAVIMNSTLVLGTTVLIKPFAIVDLSPYAISIPFFILSIVLFNIFLRTKNQFSKWEGVILILVYLIFIALFVWQNKIIL